MGYAARANAMNSRDPRTKRDEELRRLLNLFADRSTYEQWCTKSQIDDEHRAAMEAYLPARLQAQGAV